MLSLLLTLMAPPAGALCTTSDPDFDDRRYPEAIAHCRRHVPVAARRWVRLGRPGCAEIDHLIPLSLGGSNALANLWCQTAAAARRKDALENRLYRALLAGTMTQAEAVRLVRLR